MPTADSSKLGYIRIPSSAHDPQLQFAALPAVGVHASQVFTDYTPGTGAQRPALTRLLSQIQPGDTLVTWRVGRSLSRLIRLIIDLGAKGVWFTSITEAIDTTPPEGHPQLRMIVALAACEHHLRCEYTAVGVSRSTLYAHLHDLGPSPERAGAVTTLPTNGANRAINRRESQSSNQPRTPGYMPQNSCPNSTSHNGDQPPLLVCSRND